MGDGTVNIVCRMANNVINTDVQKRRFAIQKCKYGWEKRMIDNIGGKGMIAKWVFLQPR